MLHTNNTGELSAIGRALSWALEEIQGGRMDGVEEISIVSDSLYSIQMTRGAWKAKTNKVMIWKLKALKKQIEATMPVRLCWTKAHTKEESAEAY